MPRTVDDRIYTVKVALDLGLEVWRGKPEVAAKFRAAFDELDAIEDGIVAEVGGYLATYIRALIEEVDAIDDAGGDDLPGFAALTNLVNLEVGELGGELQKAVAAMVAIIEEGRRHDADT